jgi:hypothetical protein
MQLIFFCFYLSLQIGLCSFLVNFTMRMSENKKNNNRDNFLSKIEKRSDISEAIAAFLKGLTVQESIDTLDAV